MGELLQNAYPDRDNVLNLIVKYVDDDGAESTLNLTSLTRVTLVLYSALNGADVLLDSDIILGITWGADGKITIPFNGQNIDDGQFKSSIAVYDSGHPNGQYIAHPDSNSRLYIRVSNDS